jgi:predicted nucleic acid-binding protein
MRYFDASALVKRYVREKGSAKVQRLLAAEVPATSRLSAVEIASAVARRLREGNLSGEDRDRILAALDRDLTAVLVVEVTAAVVTSAQGLLQRHPLRTGDAIQLASCLHLQEHIEEDVTFVGFDDRLLAAARAERLTTL